jgi:hypothetical protein
MVSCCLFLHNMGVCDRVMGNPEKRYDPGAAEDVEEEDIGHILEDNIILPPLMRPPLLQPEAQVVTTNIRDFDIELAQMITQRTEIRTLANKTEYLRLQRALIAYVHSWKQENRTFTL